MKNHEVVFKGVVTFKTSVSSDIVDVLRKMRDITDLKHEDIQYVIEQYFLVDEPDVVGSDFVTIYIPDLKFSLTSPDVLRVDDALHTL